MGRVELTAGQTGPVGFVDALAIDLLFPEDLDLFTLGVVLQARETNKRLVSRRRRQFHVLDQIAPRADADHFARLRRNVNCRGHRHRAQQTELARLVESNDIPIQGPRGPFRRLCPTTNHGRRDVMPPAGLLEDHVRQPEFQCQNAHWFGPLLFVQFFTGQLHSSVRCVPPSGALRLAWDSQLRQYLLAHGGSCSDGASGACELCPCLNRALARSLTRILTACNSGDHRNVGQTPH